MPPRMYARRTIRFGRSSQKTASLYPKRAMDIEKETQATIALAEAMEKAGGIDAEVFGQSLAKLRKFYSADSSQEMAKGVQD